MYQYGAKWTGTDISPEQIEQAKLLSEAENKNIEYLAVSTEDIDLPKESFDVITACQCFWYFDHERVMPKLAELLKPEGKLVILYMAWLPYEDRIAGMSEELVLKYNPKWSGAGETRHPICIPDAVYEHFEMVDHEEYDLMVPFTKESWHGRMRACRGVGASLSEEELARWDREHRELLHRIAPEQFEVSHYAALTVLRKR
jgi:SAM-dependent methyltransferase